MHGNLILNTSSPINALQAASKGYVDKKTMSKTLVATFTDNLDSLTFDLKRDIDGILGEFTNFHINNDCEITVGRNSNFTIAYGTIASEVNFGSFKILWPKIGYYSSNHICFLNAGTGNMAEVRCMIENDTRIQINGAFVSGTVKVYTVKMNI